MKVCSVCRRCFEDTAHHCCEEGHSLLQDTINGSPDLINGFRIESRVSANPFFEVYRARQLATGHTCVIKLIPPNAVREQPFLSEARSAATFYHPNFVDIYEAGALPDGELFVVCEDGGGPTLREYLDLTRTPDLLTSVTVVRQAAEALHAFHLRGLIHRSVNPDNIVLSFDSGEAPLVRVKDPDLGGAIGHSIVSNKFLIDHALDPLTYFAPERFDEDACGIKSDIYSLGIILYEMLAGAPPFSASKAAGLIEMHRSRQPAEIRIDNFDLRMLLTHTLTESLQKEPRLRQSSANAFARQLRHIEQLATHVSTPPPAGKMLPMPARSMPRVAVDVQGAPFVTPNEVVGLDVSYEPVEPGEKSLSEINVGSPKAVLETTSEMETVDNGQNRSRLKLHRKRFHDKQTQVPGILIVQRETAADDLRDDGLEIEIPGGGQGPERRGTELPAVTASPRAPVKIEWQTPDDDIPSIEDVVEARADESGGSALTSAAPQGLTEEIPSPVKPAQLIPKRLSTKSRPEASGAPPLHKVPVQTEPDEITLVRPHGRPIYIDIERPAPKKRRAPERRVIPGATSEAAFFPTLLGIDANDFSLADTDKNGDTFLSDYTSTFQPWSGPKRRTTAVAGGVVLLFSLFLFGGRFLRLDVQADRDRQPIAATTASVEPAPETVQPEARNKRNSDKDVKTNQPAVNDKPESKKKDERNADKSKGNEIVIRNSRPESSHKPSIEKPKPASSIVAGRKLARSTEPAPVKTAGLTRPRIVANPKP